jgi:hypothetical protein
LGNLSFSLAVKVFKWSSLKPVKEIKSEIKTDSFSAKIVYSHSIPDLIKDCGNRSDCVLLVEIENKEHKIAVKILQFYEVFKIIESLSDTLVIIFLFLIKRHIILCYYQSLKTLK